MLCLPVACQPFFLPTYRQSRLSFDRTMLQPFYDAVLRVHYFFTLPSTFNACARTGCNSQRHSGCCCSSQLDSQAWLAMGTSFKSTTQRNENIKRSEIASRVESAVPLSACAAGFWICALLDLRTTTKPGLWSFHENTGSNHSLCTPWQTRWRN